MAYPHATSAIERLIAEARIATLGTNGRHGPHPAPVWFEYEDGEFRVRRRGARHRVTAESGRSGLRSALAASHLAGRQADPCT
jgi:Pyridoxamine 5'-phosphate oxidase